MRWRLIGFNTPCEKEREKKKGIVDWFGFKIDN